MTLRSRGFQIITTKVTVAVQVNLKCWLLVPSRNSLLAQLVKITWLAELSMIVITNYREEIEGIQ